MLRFFAFFKSRSLEPFSSYQKGLIEKETLFYIQEYEGELEEVNVVENYFTLIFLINMKMDIKKMLAQIVNECNQYGDFVDPNFVITNVKIFSEEDIQKELQKN